MAKKFVRGITDIKTINNQDLDTNNVNDLLSDGEHNYIHRKKKDGTEEYHNLTNNLKTIQSDNTDLVSVTNYNNTTNSATIRPKHDAQKEQVLESTDETIVISHGENGTDETTNVDVNPDKIAEMVAPMVAPTNRQIYENYGYYHDKVYATVKTFVRPISNDEEEFCFMAHVDKSVGNISLDVSEHDLKAFKYLINKYGSDNSLKFNGLQINLIMTYVVIYNHDMEKNNVVSFSDIIPTNLPVEDDDNDNND